MTDATVYIVLATFNGERYLQEQIRSIQAQSCPDWVLLVSDDGSTDGTVDIIQASGAEDSRIELLAQRAGCAGHVENFAYLLEEVASRNGNYVFLADQDDVWLPSKLERMVSILDEAEEGTVAVFSDLEMTDCEGVCLGSFMKTNKLEGMSDTRSLLCQNSVVGCSMLVDSALLRLALPFPENLQNHDWWLALCASAAGKLEYLPDRLVLYRQHEGNTIGGRNYRVQAPKLVEIMRRQRRVFDSKRLAVAELVRRFGERGEAVPETLLAWQQQFNGEGGWRLPWQLLTGDFTPKSRQLLALQLLAVSPLMSRESS